MTTSTSGSGRGADLPLPFPPTSTEGMAARWVRWAAAAGPWRTPLADPTGEDAARNQPADVWFLAGTTGGEERRHITVPARTPLFGPAFCLWSSDVLGRDDLPDAYGTVTVDGEARPTTPTGTPSPFDVRGVWLNPVTRTRRTVPLSVWGVWAEISPLAPGRHEIVLDGGDGHGFTVGVHFTVDVTRD
ncbi:MULTISPECIES: hypothetical protein [Cellulosimicrobium]|uniref:hypothetical protein n=1 Tax=Cellulosimicrobium TaxID=157920 RepID=UPI000318047F|nr:MULTISPECIES: hypothetical protein [Cellulosimicrobium]KFD42748.1 hypothetical protein IU11_18245 [Cellulosimicrobium sp. MM]